MKIAQTLSRGLAPLILVALAAAAGAWAIRGSATRKARAEQAREKQMIATVEVARGDFEMVVGALGALESISSTPVVTQVSGDLAYLVPNGVRVKEGDVIAELDLPRMARTVRDQALEYENARHELETRTRELAAGVELSRISLEQAKEELRRFRAQQVADLANKEARRDYDRKDLELNQERLERKKKLAAEGLLAKREVELGTADIEAKKFDVERQTKELELARKRKSSDDRDKEDAVQKAEAEVERASSAEKDELRQATVALAIRKQQFDRVKTQFEKGVIRAPRDGIVVAAVNEDRGESRPLETGDHVWENRQIASLPDLSRMRAVLELPQEQARLAKLGLPAKIRVEALPRLEFDGKVTQIAQTASESQMRGTSMPTGRRTFKTQVEVIDNKGAALRPGMTATVRIIVEHLPKAVSLPLECVFDREDRKVVYVKSGSRFEEVEVKLGPKNDDSVVVTRGLRGGEQVALRDLQVTAEGGAASTRSTGLPSALPLQEGE
jgi:HlyD family secretion protein